MYETFYYHSHSGLQTGLAPEQMRQVLKEESGLLWVDMNDIDDIDIDILTDVFSLHSLTIEDFIMVNARPKIENFRDYLFMIMLSMDSHDKDKGKVNTAEIDFCLGKNFLITAHNNIISPLSVSKERIKKQSPIIMHGADFLLYSLVDSVVDSYFPIINEFDNMVDEMSDELFRDPSNSTLHKIYNLKNSIMYLRRTIGPQADLMALMARGDFPLICANNTIYFRNVHDNMVRLNDIVGTSRDIVTGAMEAYVSVISNRLNEIMKTLTVIATIMMPLTLIASFYGMNFKYMPELSSKFGYPFVIILMISIAAVMLRYFKRKNWI
ncbi:MAG: magnesium/cobalt transporter CorA [Candidatus Omnitrophica bacterium]|jgi:magnesium transporter|nr:magnesium/cobalt transporter CorA [Candidatus Omnitrophota bacterium]